MHTSMTTTRRTDTMPRSRAARLVDYLWMNQYKQFDVGVHDCSLFACRWVDAELGTDYEARVAALLRGQTIGVVLNLIRVNGAYRRLVVEMTGQLPTSDLNWQSGDVALFRRDDGVETIGLLSSRLVHAPGPESLVSFDASRATCYWSLECLKR